MSTYNYDLIVIGAGSAGLSAARFAASFGAKVALVERRRLGGDCTWTGCIPSKALIHAANSLQIARSSPFMEGSHGSLKVDMGRVRRYVHDAVAEISGNESPELLTAAGIEIVMGKARFLDPHTVQAGDKSLSAKRFIINTGARPIIPPIPGLPDVPYETHVSFFENERLPNHLLVIGAGPVGVEIAQSYGRFGSQVTLVDLALLPAEEEDVRLLMKGILADEGVRFVEGWVEGARRSGDDIVLDLADGKRSLAGDMLLVAAGRRPNTQGIGLEAANVIADDVGIRVDKNLRTSASHIFAAGDCLGGPQFTHLAGWQGYRAARNALLPGSNSGENDVLPETTFTDPEIARVGLREAEARAKYGDDVTVTKRDAGLIDRAVTDSAKRGFIKLIYLGDGTIVGAAIVAPNAGELISQFAVAIRHGIKLGDLAGTMHVYPTFAGGVQMMAADIATERFVNSTVGRLLRRVKGFAQ